MSPSTSLFTLSLVVRVAARTFAVFQGFAQACRPVSSPLKFQSVNVVLPGRRAVTTIFCASLTLRVQGQCLLLPKQWSTDLWTRASKNLGQLIQGERA